jgi:hypothetical protein
MKVLITMRQALADKAVLGDAMPGDSWRAWRVLLIASAGEKLTVSERRLFAKLTGRPREPSVMVSTLLIVAGRRSGKTKAMSVFAVWLATCVDWSGDLSLGEVGVALFLSPVERQAEVAHGYSAALIDHVELFKAQVVNRTARSIELHTRVELRTEAANWRHNRGSTCIGICLDESAFLRSSDDSANGDMEIMQALRPSLSTTGGPMLLTSSPAAMEGIVYKVFERHHGAKGDKRVLVVQADSRTLNPTLRRDVVDRAFEDDAVAAAAEYGGQFRAPMTSYLERSIVQQAVDVGVTVRSGLPGADYCAFVDVAGGSGQDSFCAAIGHKHVREGREICVIDALFEQRPKFDPDEVTARCAAWLRLWSINFAHSDSYAARWPVTAFAKHGIRIMASPLSASELYAHTIPAWTAGRVRLLDNPRAVDQLCGLKRKVGQSGREVIEHPRGSHDDISVCVAGVLWRLTPVQQKMVYGGFGVFTGPRTGFPGYFGDAEDAAFRASHGLP